MPDGRSFVEAVLDASILYSKLVARLIDERPARPTSHITGHGFLKVMRPLRPLTYRINFLPPVPPVLDFMATARHGPRAAYTTLNMGAGWRSTRARARAIAWSRSRARPVTRRVAGVAEEGPRRVVLEPIDVTLEGEEMVLAPE